MEGFELFELFELFKALEGLEKWEVLRCAVRRLRSQSVGRFTVVIVIFLESLE